MTPKTADVPAAGQFRRGTLDGMAGKPDRRTGRSCTGLFRTRLAESGPA